MARYLTGVMNRFNESFVAIFMKENVRCITITITMRHDVWKINDDKLGNC